MAFDVLQGFDGKVAESRWSVAGLDPIPVEVVLPPASVLLNTGPAEWQGLFPISSLLRGVSLPGPPPQAGFAENGRPTVEIQLVRARICQRLLVEMNLYARYNEEIRNQLKLVSIYTFILFCYCQLCLCVEKYRNACFTGVETNVGCKDNAT